MGIGMKILTQLNFIACLGDELTRSTYGILFFVVTILADLRSLRAVVMGLERPMSEEYFTLEDAAGFVFPIHLRTVISWAALEYVLQQQFMGRKGARRVQRRQYVLRERGTHRELSQSLPWEKAFRPCQKVDMSLICRESGAGVGNRGLSGCPRCKAVTPYRMSSEVQW